MQKHLDKDNNNSKIIVTTNVTIPDVKLWHSRFGHTSSQDLKHLKLMECKNDSEILNKSLVCPLAKQARVQFLSCNSRASILFEVVHIDIW